MGDDFVPRNGTNQTAHMDGYSLTLHTPIRVWGDNFVPLNGTNQTADTELVVNPRMIVLDGSERPARH